MASITTFEIGYCTHLGCMALRGSAVRHCKFPSRAYLLTVGERRWLWDTGYASHFHSYTDRGVFRLYRRVTPVYFSPHQALVEQLRCQGICVGDIEAVIISHFHADHIAGLRDFSGINMICSGEGWRQTRDLRGIAALKRAFVPGLIPEGFESALQFVEAFPRRPCPASWRHSNRATCCRAAAAKSSSYHYRVTLQGISAPLCKRMLVGRYWRVMPPGRR
ncbi:ribonuclease Z [Serratia rubidaea]|uniref:Ribonuclease Z n=1 Tax=Serratia rubidaea TaxID=61652 RepID=A0A3S4FMY3_SERRU|nr:ribonuclease Z [Serratia rubidaea]